jgi:hypothetical protein
MKRISKHFGVTHDLLVRAEDADDADKILEIDATDGAQRQVMYIRVYWRSPGEAMSLRNSNR